MPSEVTSHRTMERAAAMSCVEHLEVHGVSVDVTDGELRAAGATASYKASSGLLCLRRGGRVVRLRFKVRLKTVRVTSDGGACSCALYLGPDQPAAARLRCDGARLAVTGLAVASVDIRAVRGATVVFEHSSAERVTCTAKAAVVSGLLARRALSVEARGLARCEFQVARRATRSVKRDPLAQVKLLEEMKSCVMYMGKASPPPPLTVGGDATRG